MTLALRPWFSRRLREIASSSSRFTAWASPLARMKSYIPSVKKPSESWVEWATVNSSITVSKVTRPGCPVETSSTNFFSSRVLPGQW